MENGQKTISDLFESRRIFNIPKYQRAYSWEERQLQDFMKDLENQSLNRDYFYGTILLQVRDSEGHFKIIDIVDGQQRITTLTIFMKVLLEKLEIAGDDVSILRESYIKYRDEYKLRVLEYDNAFFKNYIMEDKAEPEEDIKTPSQRRLLKAKKFFKEELAELSDDVAREYREKLERAKVLTYAVSNNAEATLIFETTNDRGKPLTSLEKIKSFLMYKLYLTADNPEEQLQTIQTQFGEIYKDFEEITPYWSIDEDDVLRYHYIAFVQEATEKTNVYSTHLYSVKNKINELASQAETFKNAANFIDDYSHELRETFAVIKSMTDLFVPFGDLLNFFHVRRSSNFIPLLVTALKYDDTEDKCNFNRVTRLAEIISFRVYGIRKRKGNNAAIIKRLYGLAQNFRGEYEPLISNLKDLIGEYCSDYEFAARLNSSTFYDDISTNDLTYLLWRYENHLRIHEYMPEPLIAYRKYRNLSVEHIISQTLKHPPDWLTDDFYNDHIHSLGNLTLDVSTENSSKSNLPFDRKYVYYYEDSRFVCQRELDKFINSDTEAWDDVSLLTRHNKLLCFALECWDYRNV